MIDFTAKTLDDGTEVIFLESAPVTLLKEQGENWRIIGAGYAAVWEYSADYIAEMLDRKFKDGEL